MKNNIKIAVAALLGVLFSTCTLYDFDKEQHVNEISLLSNLQLIYDRQVAQIRAEGDIIYVVATLSGTNASTTPFRVSIMEPKTILDENGEWAVDAAGELLFVSQFDRFNRANFDRDTTRFARLLPAERFTIPNMSGQINAGAFMHRFPIHLKDLEGLSPDTVYFLNFKINPATSDAFNVRNQEVLLRIHWENEIASTRAPHAIFTFINSTITNLTTDHVGRPTASQRVFPLGENSVRVLAGDLSMGATETALPRINAGSITLTLGEQTGWNPYARHVTITPFDTIEVEQLPPYRHFDNTFAYTSVSTPDGRITHFKEFRLHYKYRVNRSVPGWDHAVTNDEWRVVQGILRMEYNPRDLIERR